MGEFVARRRGRVGLPEFKWETPVLKEDQDMRSPIVVVLTIALVGVATCARAQTVVTYYPSSVPVTTYYAPTTTYYAPTTTYYAPSVPTTAYYAPTTAYYGGRGYYGRYNRGGLFGTGLGGWAGLRGIGRRWDRRGW
jgi:hypothetical protein